MKKIILILLLSAINCVYADTVTKITLKQTITLDEQLSQGGRRNSHNVISFKRPGVLQTGTSDSGDHCFLFLVSDDNNTTAIPKGTSFNVTNYISKTGMQIVIPIAYVDAKIDGFYNGSKITGSIHCDQMGTIFSLSLSKVNRIYSQIAVLE